MFLKLSANSNSNYMQIKDRMDDRLVLNINYIKKEKNRMNLWLLYENQN